MVKLNRIYTRTGDAGTSGLVGGVRLPKQDALFGAIGDVDEANGTVGMAIVALTSAGDQPVLAAQLTVIQNDLFDLGADLATPAADGDAPFAPGAMALRITPDQVTRLEREIDVMNADLAPLRSFILPGGSECAARLHIARSVTRRAERSAVAAGAARRLNPAALAYLNRLSDYLFVAARVVNGNGADDVLWVPGASRGA
ncbi:MAG: cob(I)yrinic acid a,c-diamide adenosyltransferase [Sphingopyxis sp.]